MTDIFLVSADTQLTAPLDALVAERKWSFGHAASLEALPERLAAAPAKLLLVDLDLWQDPPWEGIALLRAGTPGARGALILVSGRFTTPRHMLAGLRLGAVEYIAKPCEPRVLFARLEALLAAISRRGRTAPETLLSVLGGRLELDLKAHRCLLAGADGKSELSLPPMEFLLLAQLLGRRNELVTKAELFRMLWPAAPDSGNEITLHQHVSRLRRRLGLLGRHLKTVWRLGYRFEG